MKILKLTIGIVLFSAILYAQSASAVKRAPFQNSSSLQPIPSSDIHPNISGNVNSSNGVPSAGENPNAQNSDSSNVEQPINQQNSLNNTLTPNETAISGFSFVKIIFMAGILLIGAILVIFYLSRRKD